MSITPFDLMTSAASVHSQGGEDGILAKLFETKGITQGFFCEFGAWDGRHLSNTYALYKKGWVGCYIEGDERRFRDLQKNIESPTILVLSFVAISGPNSLDAIFARNDIASVDLLSIDIDSDDLAVWRSLKDVRPRVVVIEFNPTIPIDTRFENSPGANHGNSFLSILEHAHSTGYDMVAVTSSNIIFVDDEFNAGAFRVIDVSDLAGRVGLRFFFGYDGTLFRYDAVTGQTIAPEFHIVPWLGSVFTQPVAKALRRFDPGPRTTSFAHALAIVSAVARRPLSIFNGYLRKSSRSKR